MRYVLAFVFVTVMLAACSENQPTGPTVHCFNATTSTGKISVVCPTGQ